MLTHIQNSGELNKYWNTVDKQNDEARRAARRVERERKRLEMGSEYQSSTDGEAHPKVMNIDSSEDYGESSSDQEVADDGSNENKFNQGIAAVSGDLSNINEQTGDNKSLEENRNFKSGIENKQDHSHHLSGQNNMTINVNEDRARDALEDSQRNTRKLARSPTRTVFSQSRISNVTGSQKTLPFNSIRYIAMLLKNPEGNPYGTEIGNFELQNDN
mmetsp:Transcript_17741/g.30040  ORF Transcript_17741/g.30040 Transcript_17741/m.30040 type:complete len:216 (-) Transcript_17741:20-667(-)